MTVTGATGYANVGGKDVIYYSSAFDGNSANNGLWSYTVNSATNPALNTWAHVGSDLSSSFSTFGNQGVGAFDSKDNLFVRTAQIDGAGDYGIVYWSLNTPGPGNTWHLATFPGSALKSNGYFMGMDWDPTLDLFYLWDGNGEVWKLDPKTWALTGLFPTGGTPVESTGGNTFTGVLGDWHYLSGLGVFAGVTTDYVNGVFTPQVWLYDPGTGGSQNQVPLPVVAAGLATALDGVTDPAIPEPGVLGVLLFGAGFALSRRRRR
jgi:hypothetical protein